MLGWFKMTPETSLEDVEWLLARSSGYDAGYAFVADLESIAQNGYSNKILELIGEWEKLRIGGLFSEQQKELLRDATKEFSLQKINANEWILQAINAEIFNHKKKVKQPGEPLFSTFTFNNIGNEQTLNFAITAIDCEASDIVLEINNYKEIKLPVVLSQGQTIKYTGGNRATVYDANWQLIKEFDLNHSSLQISKGENTISFDCNFAVEGKNSNIKLEIRTFGKEEKIISDK
jgi:hypothetical protein